LEHFLPVDWPHDFRAAIFLTGFLTRKVKKVNKILLTARLSWPSVCSENKSASPAGSEKSQGLIEALFLFVGFIFAQASFCRLPNC